VRNDPSRSSKVVDFGTNRKHVCDFLLVVNSNLDPILPRFRDIAGFLRRATPPLFHRILWVRSEDPKLIIHVINFEREGAHESAYLRQALAFNAEKFRGHVTLATPPFGNIFGVMFGLSLRTLVPNLKSVALIVFELLAFNAEKFRGSRDPSYAPFGKIFGGHVWTVPGNTCANLKSVALIVFELLAFNAEKFRGSRDPSYAPFLKNFWGSCPDSPWEHLSNFKSVALTVFELLALNAQKFRESRDPVTPPFGKIFGSHVRTVPGKKCVKFQVCSFNRF